MEKNEMQAQLVWAAVATSIAFYLTVLKRLGGRKRLPPGPTPLPLLGNLLKLHGVVHHRLASMARVYGPVMTIKLGLNNAVVISSRDAAREAITKHDRRIAARMIPDTFRACGFAERSVVFMPSSNPQWKNLRGIQGTHIFTPRGLATVRPIRERKVRDLVGYFRAHAGEALVIRHAIHTGVLNLVSSSFFSIDMADLGSDTANELREVVDEIITAFAKPNVSDFVPFLRPLDLQGWRRWTEKRFSRVYNILNDIIERRVEHTRANKEKHDDFLDTLLELMAGGKIDRDSVNGMLFEAFVAGADTIAFTVEWVMAELLRNPGEMAKVRKELKDVLGSKETIEETDTANLPYLQAVLKEAMRLHPVGPLLVPHFAVEDGVEIGGYTVPKGSTVVFNAWAIMRDPAAWERPDEFVPERFMDKEHPYDFRGKELEFIPFGSGRRQCPGMPLAERVVPFLLASMLHPFEWRLPSGMAADEVDLSERYMTANVLDVPLKAVPVLSS
uniref:Cytochrome P450 n=1 Tax=Leersia perrieri TaxID=77586 RepID=A0A0D9VHC4_9ORYZ